MEVEVEEKKNEDANSSDDDEENESREFKFLTVRQILCKIDPRSLRQTPEDDHLRRESSVWSFQKSSNIFPTIIIDRRCRLTYTSNRASVCNHTTYFYWGGDVLHSVVSGSEICLLLQQANFGLPQHLQQHEQDRQRVLAGLGNYVS